MLTKEIWSQSQLCHTLYMENHIPPLGDHRLVRLMEEFRLDFRRLFGIIPRRICEPQYLFDIQNIIERFPVNQQTSEYMMNILEITRSGTNNYDLEEFIKIHNPELYSIYIDNRRKITNTIFRMKNMRVYDRYFLWKHFERSFGKNPISTPWNS